MADTHITVWHDTTSDRHGWIVDLCDGDTTDTLAVCGTERKAEATAAVLRRLHIQTAEAGRTLLNRMMVI